MFDQVLVEFAALVGFAALVSLIVNVLKIIKLKGIPIIQDGTADKWVAGFNLAGVLALLVVKQFFPELQIQPIDSLLGEIAIVGSYIFSYVVMLLGSKLTYVATKGLPVIGKSHTEDGVG